MTFKTKQELARFFDHTLLKADGTFEQLDRLCDEALEYGFFGVCVNSCHVARVTKRLISSNVVPLAVVGFPLGAMETTGKVYETRMACDQGAKEIDTVVNLGFYFSQDLKATARDISSVVKAAGSIPTKVILETCYLKPEQITELTLMCVREGAAFVKTSTGFGSRGASVEDVQTMHAALKEVSAVGKVGIKASGGIKDLEFVRKLVEAGATRIGASASVNILHELKTLH